MEFCKNIAEKYQRGIFDTIDDFDMSAKTLGLGAYGVVKQATHMPTRRLYALKIIEIKPHYDSLDLQLLEKEIKAHLELDHPHIVKLWDVLYRSNRIYMIMECVEGGNLFQYQQLRHKLHENQAFKIFYQTLKAVEFMHHKNYFHRDLKPENILLDAKFDVKLCDFGEVASDLLEKKSVFCGTFEYMAPELLFEQQYDFRVDIWALGVLLFELLHSEAPFSGETLEEVREKISKGLYVLRKDLHSDIVDIIHKLLQFEPQHRIGIPEILKHPWMVMHKKKMGQKNQPSQHNRNKFRKSQGDLSPKPKPEIYSKRVSKRGLKKHKTIEDQLRISMIPMKNLLNDCSNRKIDKKSNQGEPETLKKWIMGHPVKTLYKHQPQRATKKQIKRKPNLTNHMV